MVWHNLAQYDFHLDFWKLAIGAEPRLIKDGIYAYQAHPGTRIIGLSFLLSFDLYQATEKP